MQSRTRVQRLKDTRDRAEADLAFFAKLVLPNRMYGSVHEEVFSWWQSEERKSDTLLLLPRDHQKSHLAAVRAAWQVTREPWATILYVSATAALAEQQLYAIKNIIDSPRYKRLWPEMINKDAGKREKWTTNMISVDHPRRKEEGVRDPTVWAAGLTTNTTGFHANYIFMDDLVVPDNAYTEDGRRQVASRYSQLASIETTGGKTVAVGTRYHPKDIYQTMLDARLDVFDCDGELESQTELYDVFQRVVETDGEFLWPKTQREDGRFFGFDANELAKKRAKYFDTTQYYAQYYNNPNDPGNAKVNPKLFQYYDRKFLEQSEGYWFYKQKKLNVFAAIDFAFSLKRKADYTSIVAVGVDADQQYYILDIDRFKTQSIKEYFDRIMMLHQKWEFRKLRAEVSVAQEVIVEDLKTNYIVPNGVILSVDSYRPSRHEGNKEERMLATLGPRYDNQQMWHYKGGYCSLLEEELKLQHPPHDDISDALTAAVDVAVAPSRRGWAGRRKQNNVVTHARFGGIR